MSVVEALEAFGLRPNEIKVYLAALQLGTARVNSVAKKAGILRTTAYEVAKSLVDKGIAGTVIKAGVVYLEVIDPRQLEGLLQEKQAMMHKVLPELIGMKQSVREKPAVELYEGKEGLKTILQDILKTKKTFCAYTNYRIFRLLQFTMPQFVKKRIENKIFARIIQQKVKPLIRMKEQNIREYRDMRFSPVVFKSNVFIYGDNVALLNVSKREPIGVVIRNKDIANTQRQVFEMLWKIAKN